MKHSFIVWTIITFLLTACGNNKTSDAPNGTDSASTTTGMNAQEEAEEKNKQTALANEKAFNDHNLDKVLADFAADFVEYGDGSMPPVKGLDSNKSSITNFMASFPDYKAENLMALADGDRVAVIGEFSGTFKKNMGGMKATNKKFKMKDVDIYTFNSAGKITEHRSVYPLDNVLRQLGTSMPKKH